MSHLHQSVKSTNANQIIEVIIRNPRYETKKQPYGFSLLCGNVKTVYVSDSKYFNERDPKNCTK